jgi:hypothetical protein
VGDGSISIPEINHNIKSSYAGIIYIYIYIYIYIDTHIGRGVYKAEGGCSPGKKINPNLQCPKL